MGGAGSRASTPTRGGAGVCLPLGLLNAKCELACADLGVLQELDVPQHPLTSEPCDVLHFRLTYTSSNALSLTYKSTPVSFFRLAT